MNRSVTRREALRLAALTCFVAVSSLGLPGGALAQLSPGPPKSEKDRDKLFDQIRIDWGLIGRPVRGVAGQPEVDEAPGVGGEPRVGDELSDEVEDVDAMADALVARLRGSLKRIDVRAYTRDQRIEMKRVLLRTEAGIRGIVGSFARSELNRSEARERVRAAFAGFLTEIEAYPRSGQR